MFSLSVPVNFPVKLSPLRHAPADIVCDWCGECDCGLQSSNLVSGAGLYSKESLQELAREQKFMSGVRVTWTVGIVVIVQYRHVETNRDELRAFIQVLPCTK